MRESVAVQGQPLSTVVDCAEKTWESRTDSGLIRVAAGRVQKDMLCCMEKSFRKVEVVLECRTGQVGIEKVEEDTSRVCYCMEVRIRMVEVVLGY